MSWFVVGVHFDWLGSAGGVCSGELLILLHQLSLQCLEVFVAEQRLNNDLERVLDGFAMIWREHAARHS